MAKPHCLPCWGLSRLPGGYKKPLSRLGRQAHRCHRVVTVVMEAREGTQRGKEPEAGGCLWERESRSHPNSETENSSWGRTSRSGGDSWPVHSQPAPVPADNTTVSELSSLHQEDSGFRHSYHQTRSKPFPVAGDLDSDPEYWASVMGGGSGVSRAMDYSKEDRGSFRHR